MQKHNALLFVMRQKVYLFTEIGLHIMEKSFKLFRRCGHFNYGDENVCEYLLLQHLATEEDYATEYLSLTLSVKVVENVFEAIDHINHYGTNHSEAIITEDH